MSTCHTIPIQTKGFEFLEAGMGIVWVAGGHAKMGALPRGIPYVELCRSHGFASSGSSICGSGWVVSNIAIDLSDQSDQWIS